VRALRWDGTQLALARDIPEPVRGAGEALVRVRLAGICRTDLEITRGYLGFRGTLGHEWVGRVAAADDPNLIGARVVGDINLACGRCTACAAGLGRHCPTRRVLGIVDADGAIADWVLLPAVNLHRVPDAVPDPTAVFAEPVAAACEVLDQVADVRGRRAIVLGGGKLGLLVAQVLGAAGADVLVAGRGGTPIARATTLGLASGTPRPGADLVVDATGDPAGLATALGLVRPRGTVVMKTTIATPHRIDLGPAVVNEVTLVGSRCGRFAPALAALAQGRVAVAPLVDAVYPLDDAVEAFTRAAAPGTLKVLVDAVDG
jgi:threonine dehydrogenase-like Zn-dependent dehydrogenase